MQQQLLQVKGVGDVELGGGSLPAVRVELNPFALARYGIGLEDVRAAIQAANANRPKGMVEGGGRRLQIYTHDPGPEGGRLCAAGGRLAQRRRGAAARRRRRRTTGSRTRARWACSTASARSSC